METFKDYHTSFTVFLEILKKKKKKKALKKKKKKALKMTSQLVIFRAFLFIFFVPPTLDLKKNSVNKLIKKIWPKFRFKPTFPKSCQ